MPEVSPEVWKLFRDTQKKLGKENSNDNLIETQKKYMENQERENREMNAYLKAGVEGLKEGSENIAATLGGKTREILGSGITEYYDLTKNVFKSVSSRIIDVYKERQAQKQEKELTKEEQQNLKDDRKVSKAMLEEGSIYTHDIHSEKLLEDTVNVLHQQQEDFQNISTITMQGNKMQADSQRITKKALNMLYDKSEIQEEGQLTIEEMVSSISNTLTEQAKDIYLMRIGNEGQVNILEKMVLPFVSFYKSWIKDKNTGTELVVNRLIEIRRILSKAYGISEASVAEENVSRRLFYKIIRSPLTLTNALLNSFLDDSEKNLGVMEGFQHLLGKGEERTFTIQEKQTLILYDILQAQKQTVTNTKQLTSGSGDMEDYFKEKDKEEKRKKAPKESWLLKMLGITSLLNLATSAAGIVTSSMGAILGSVGAALGLGSTFSIVAVVGAVMAAAWSGYTIGKWWLHVMEGYNDLERIKNEQKAVSRQLKDAKTLKDPKASAKEKQLAEIGSQTTKELWKIDKSLDEVIGDWRYLWDGHKDSAKVTEALVEEMKNQTEKYDKIYKEYSPREIKRVLTEMISNPDKYNLRSQAPWESDEHYGKELEKALRNLLREIGIKGGKIDKNKQKSDSLMSSLYNNGMDWVKDTVKATKDFFSTLKSPGQFLGDLKKMEAPKLQESIKKVGETSEKVVKKVETFTEKTTNVIKKSWNSLVSFFTGRSIKESGKELYQKGSTKGKGLLDSGIDYLTKKYETNKAEAGEWFKTKKGHMTFGPFQMIKSTVSDFIKKSKYKDKFMDTTGKMIEAGSDKFNQIWSEVGKLDPKGFLKEQKDYIYDTHYTPIKNKLKNRGIDLDEKDIAFKQFMHSFSNWFGGGDNANKVLDEAFKGVKDAGKLTTEQIIQLMTDAKEKAVRGEILPGVFNLNNIKGGMKRVKEEASYVYNQLKKDTLNGLEATKESRMKIAQELREKKDLVLASTQGSLKSVGNKVTNIGATVGNAIKEGTSQTGAQVFNAISSMSGGSRQTEKPPYRNDLAYIGMAFLEGA